MARLSFVINSFLGSSLILTLIFADYIRKYNTDKTQGYIFFKLLVFALIPLVCDIGYYLSRGIPGKLIYYFLYGIRIIYYFSQVFLYYQMFAFVDYSAFKDPGRTQKIDRVVWVISAVHLLLLFLNLFFPFYFSINPWDNTFSHGKGYALRLVISYLPVLFILYDIFSAPKLFRRNQLSLIAIFGLLTGISSTIDVIGGISILVWPSISSALLYAYFFIIRMDFNLDPLTGIGNRYAFNEFFFKLSRQKYRESYTIIMIDMDHFKMINDTLGHLEGDNALKDMAGIIKSSIRASDFAARYGGDEFVIVVKAGPQISEQIIERITRSLEELNGKKIRPYQLQMSYGHDTYTTNSGRSIEALLNHIDSLMYKHKEDRRRITDRGIDGEWSGR